MQIAVEVDGSANVKEIAEKTGLTYEGPSFHPQIHLFRMNSEMSKREDHTRTIQVSFKIVLITSYFQRF